MAAIKIRAIPNSPSPNGGFQERKKDQINSWNTLKMNFQQNASKVLHVLAVSCFGVWPKRDLWLHIEPRSVPRFLKNKRWATTALPLVFAKTRGLEKSEGRNPSLWCRRAQIKSPRGFLQPALEPVAWARLALSPRFGTWRQTVSRPTRVRPAAKAFGLGVLMGQGSRNAASLS